MNTIKTSKPSWSLLPVAVFLALWELIARLGFFPAGLLPSFSIVVQEFYYLVSNGILGENFLMSLVRVVIGFVTGSLTGIIIGVIMGWKETINKALNPVISLFYPIPALGWLPLLMLWIGINEALPIAIIFIACLFPVLYNTVTGIKKVDDNYIKSARTMGASDLAILTTIVPPLALPNIFTGLRLNAGMAWRVIVAAEMVAIPTGIGALLMKAESLIRMDIIIVCLIVLAVMCLAFEKFFQFIESRLTAGWK